MFRSSIASHGFKQVPDLGNSMNEGRETSDIVVAEVSDAACFSELDQMAERVVYC